MFLNLKYCLILIDFEGEKLGSLEEKKIQKQN